MMGEWDPIAPPKLVISPESASPTSALPFCPAQFTLSAMVVEQLIFKNLVFWLYECHSSTCLFTYFPGLVMCAITALSAAKGA